VGIIRRSNRGRDGGKVLLEHSQRVDEDEAEEVREEYLGLLQVILIQDCTLLSLELLKIVSSIGVQVDAVWGGRNDGMEGVGLLLMILLWRLRHIELHVNRKKIKDGIMLVDWIGRDWEVRGVRMALGVLFLVGIGVIKRQVQIQIEERSKVGVRHFSHDARLLGWRRAKRKRRENG
jgi:hypothetical protein